VTALYKNYPDLTSTRFRIGGVLKNFHSGEQIQKLADSYVGIHRIRVDWSRIRKEKVADSKISWYVWTALSNDDDDKENVIKAIGLD